MWWSVLYHFSVSGVFECSVCGGLNYVCGMWNICECSVCARLCVCGGYECVCVYVEWYACMTVHTVHGGVGCVV